MQGKRKYPEDGHLYLGEGDYGKDSDGKWLVRPPGAHLGELDGHTVTEHPDGTITVSPSIEGDGFHGFLERGWWRKA